MLSITLSEAASGAYCGSKLVSAIENWTRSVFPGSAAGATGATASAMATNAVAIRRPLDVPAMMRPLLFGSLSAPARIVAGVARAAWRASAALAPELQSSNGDEAPFGRQPARG